MKTLYIVNTPFNAQVPDFINNMTGNVISYLDFYSLYGQRKFNSRLKVYADDYCKKGVNNLMAKEVDTIVVSNTFNQNNELDDFYAMARKNGYTVSSVSVGEEATAPESEGYFQNMASKLGCDSRYFSLVS